MAATARAVDFTNVKDAGNFNPRRKPAGDYRMRITKVEDHASGDSKVANNWVFTIVPIVDERSTYPYYCGFDEKQAWKIRNLCLAAGIAVPKRRVKVDPNKLVGKEIGATLDDDEYEGKTKSVIVGTFPVDELSADSPGGSAKKTSKKTSSDDDDDADDVDPDEDLDLEEI